jgi:hypothetical protein
MGGARSRVPLTFDKDFGELAWHVGLPAFYYMFRLPVPPAEQLAQILLRHPNASRLPK